MNNLPSDILGILYSYLDKNTIYLLRFVCKRLFLFLRYKKVKYSYKNFLDRVELLEWAEKQGLIFNEVFLIRISIEIDYIQPLIYLRNKEYELDYIQIARTAARKASLTILKWIHSLKIDTGYYLCDWAAMSGNIEVIEWLLYHGYTGSQRCSIEAAKKGHMKLVEYLEKRKLGHYKDIICLLRYAMRKSIHSNYMYTQPKNKEILARYKERLTIKQGYFSRERDILNWLNETKKI